VPTTAPPLAARKRYVGIRRGDTETEITVHPDAGEAYPLPLIDQWQAGRHTSRAGRLGRHEWGYPGAGPAATAASILADHTGLPQPRQLVQRFKAAVVARLPREGFELPGDRVAAWLAREVEAGRA